VGTSGAPDAFRRSVYKEKVEIMFNGFIGRYLHNIDEKGRLTFPASFRDVLGERPFILNGFDQNLLVMEASRFQLLYDRINNMNMGDVNTRQLRRLIFSTATQIEFDKSGRFIIPQSLREIARLDGSALIVGIGKDIEVWNPDFYKEMEEVGEGPASAATLVSNFDLTI
jgi:MraZ protein